MPSEERDEQRWSVRGPWWGWVALLGLVAIGCDRPAECYREEECGACRTCNNGVCEVKQEVPLLTCTFAPGQAGICQAGQCICQPQCQGRQCGDDGCGGKCGDCLPAEICADRLSRCELNGCKAGGWRSGYSYVLIRDLIDVEGDCFVIDAPEVNLDLGGHQVTSNKRPDIVVTGPLPDQPDTVGIALLVNRLGRSESPFESTGWRLEAPGEEEFGGIRCAYEPGTTKRFCNETQALADFDGDGDLDLVTAGYMTDLRIFRNERHGSFTIQPVTQIDAFDGQSRAMGIASRVLDFDQDGSPDLLIARDGGRGAFLRGLGTLLDSAMGENFRGDPWPLDEAIYAHEMAFGDLNQDNRIDLVQNGWYFQDAQEAQVRIFMNRLRPDGTGTWEDTWAPGDDAELGRGPTWVTDFDGDGLDDLLTQRSIPDEANWTYLRPNHPSTFENKTEPQAWPDTIPVAVLDADQDGDADLMLIKPDSPSQAVSQLEVWLNAGGPASFVLGSSLALEGTYAPTSGEAVCADLDEDGDPDLLLKQRHTQDQLPGAGPLRLLRNEGAGRFVQGFESLQPDSGDRNDGPGQLRDFDGDGDLDLLVPIRNLDRMAIRLYLNRGAGVFDPGEPFYQVDRDDGIGFFVHAGGDLDGPPATAIRIRQPRVTVQHAGVIRGFTVGVAVEAAATGTVLRDLLIEAPDLFAVRVDGDGTTEVTLEQVRTRFQSLGTGLGLFGVGRATVNDSSFCGYRDPRVNPTLGVYCVGAVLGTITGEGNRIGLNNGCPGLPVSTCPTAFCL